MKLVGYQPQYFPRLHYFARILKADVFAVSDHVQFVKSHKYSLSPGEYKRGKSYQSHTPIKISSVGELLLNVPVQHEGIKRINETLINYNNKWRKQHINGLRLNYSGAERFDSLFPSLVELLEVEYNNLADLNIETILWALSIIVTGEAISRKDLTMSNINDLLKTDEGFNLNRIVLKSETEIKPSDNNRDATQWIIDSCHFFGADEYLCGGTAMEAYLDVSRLKEAGIKVAVQDWKLIPYKQKFENLGFIPNLSILDLLFNEENQKVREILLN